MADIATLGLRVDSSDLKEADATLDRFTASSVQATNATRQLSTASINSGRAAQAMAVQTAAVSRTSILASNNTRMLSMQLSQVAQQAMAGGGFLRALAIQLPDIGLAFGTIGIAAGVAGGLILPIIGSLFSARDATDELDAAAEQLLQTYQRLEGLDFSGLTASAAEAMAEFAPLIAFLRDRELEQLQGQINAVISESGFAESVAQTQAEFDGLLQRLDRLEMEARNALNPETAEQYRQTIALVAGELDTVGDRLNAQQTALGQVLTISGQTREEFLLQAQAALETLDAAGQLDDEMRNVINSIIASIDPAATLADVLSDAADEASRFASNMTAFGAGVGPGLSDNVLNDLPPLPSGGGSSRRSGGGGARVDPFEQNLQRLIQSLETERETIERWYAESEILLSDHRSREFLTEQEHREALVRLEQEYQDRIRNIRGSGQNTILSESADFFGALAGITAAGGRKTAKATATFSAIQATINSYLAATQVLARPELGLFGKLAAYASVLATGLKGVAAIRQAGASVGAGGGSAGVGISAAADVAQQPEQRVFIDFGTSPKWVQDLTEDLLEQIFRETATGDRRVVVQRA